MNMKNETTETSTTMDKWNITKSPNGCATIRQGRKIIATIEEQKYIHLLLLAPELLARAKEILTYGYVDQKLKALVERIEERERELEEAWRN